MPYLHRSGFPTGVDNMGGGGLKTIHGGAWGRAENAVKKYLSRSSFDSKVASYKLVSLQIY